MRKLKSQCRINFKHDHLVLQKKHMLQINLSLDKIYWNISRSCQEIFVMTQLLGKFNVSWYGILL